MKIEILYPEISSLYGEMGAVKYLEKSFGDQNIVFTTLNDTPRFSKEKVDFVYLGPMSEKWQPRVISKLEPYKEHIKQLILNDVVFLTISTGFEIFGKEIQTETQIHKALGIFDFKVKQSFKKRHNAVVQAKFGDMIINGTKSQFTIIEKGENIEELFDIKKGFGLNLKSKKEGLRSRNFFGTHILGPLLILNPEFTRYIFSLVDESYKDKNKKLYLEEMLKSAYEQRLSYYI